MLLVISWWVICYIVHNFYKLSWNAKTDLGPVELSGTNKKDSSQNSDQNLFILYGDEIKYYFSRSNVKYLIFEDMDRFNNIDIFQKLRELNKNINESDWLQEKNKKIVFIYTLSDAIFKEKAETDNNLKDEKDKILINENKAAENKAKFFDYVISLIPFNNMNSSEEIFKEEIGNYNTLKDNGFKISDNILLGISFYISDKREIACIVADVDTYLRNLCLNQKDLKSRLKSEPDFGNKLFAAMIYKNVYPQDFDNLAKGKSNIGCFLQNIDELRIAVNNIAKRHNDNLSKYLKDKSIGNLLLVIFDNYQNIEHYDPLDPKILIALDFIKNTSILKYLLIENLIGEDFYEFISPTQFTSLSTFDQITFIQHILARYRSNTDFVISNEEDLSKIIKILNTLNIDYRYVYSSSILERLIQSIDEEKVYQMIDGLADTIYGAMEKSPKKDADSRKKIITNGENFVNKIITWLYDYKSEISNDSFILLGHAFTK